VVPGGLAGGGEDAGYLERSGGLAQAAAVGVKQRREDPGILGLAIRPPETFAASLCSLQGSDGAGASGAGLVGSDESQHLDQKPAVVGLGTFRRVGGANVPTRPVRSVEEQERLQGVAGEPFDPRGHEHVGLAPLELTERCSQAGTFIDRHGS